MNKEQYTDYMGKKIMRHELRKSDLDGMVCYRCRNLNRCADVCEAIVRKQFMISCSNFREEST